MDEAIKLLQSVSRNTEHARQPRAIIADRAKLRNTKDHQGVEKKKMPYVDLDIARKHCQEIRELVTRHPGGTRDERVLQKVQQACRAATSAVSDRECREHAGAVEDYACEVFAGAAEFRQEMLQELGAILARLAALEALRDAVAKHRAA